MVGGHWTNILSSWLVEVLTITILSSLCYDSQTYTNSDSYNKVLYVQCFCDSMVLTNTVATIMPM